MNMLKEIELDAKGTEFSIQQLLRGHNISKYLVVDVKSRLQRIWTLLPMYVNVNQVNQFDVGGVCDINVSQQLSEYVLAFLEKKSNGAWILEDKYGNSIGIDGGQCNK